MNDVVLKRKRGRPAGSKNRLRLADDEQFANNPKLKKVGVELQLTQEQIQEYIKCSEDPVYFTETYVKFLTIDGGLRNVVLYDWQKQLLLDYKNNRLNIVKTARQVGKTQTTVAFILWYILFQKDKTVAVLAQKEKTATEIMTRIKMAYENIPLWMQQGIKAWAATSIELETNTRVISESTARGAIRGFTLNLLYTDELAHVPQHVAEEFMTSIFPTISSGETAKMIITSTPLGLNLFYKFWLDAKKEYNDPNNWNGFHATEIHWNMVPGRTLEWADRQRKVLGDHKYAQEVEGEFLGSANTLISGRKLRLLTFVKPIEETYETHDGHKALQIYERPANNHSYIVSADASEGKGMDYSAFSVIDVSEPPYRIVAKFRDNTIEDVMFASAIQQTALHYNTAYVLVENNAIGALVLKEIIEVLDYDNCFFTTTDRGELEATGQGKAHRTAGLRTSVKTRAQGCAKLKTLVENDQIILNDFDIVHELSTFILSKGKKWEAEPGYNDDTTSTLWLFAWLTTQDYFKDISDLNLRGRLFAERERQLTESLPPPPVITDSVVEKPKLTIDKVTGQVWIPQEMSWDEAIETLNGLRG